jgi:hypothetical protein
MIHSHGPELTQRHKGKSFCQEKQTAGQKISLGNQSVTGAAGSGPGKLCRPEGSPR